MRNTCLCRACVAWRNNKPDRIRDPEKGDLLVAVGHEVLLGDLSLLQKLGVFLPVFLWNFQGIHGLKRIPVHSFHQCFDVGEFFLAGTLLHALLHALLYALLHTLLYTILNTLLHAVSICMISDITAVIAHVCHHPFHVLCDRDSEIPGNHFFLFNRREIYGKERTEKSDQAVF